MFVFKKSGRKASLRSISNLAEGEQIFISYIDNTSPRFERMKQLKEQYFFDCNCEFCQMDPDPLHLIKCKTHKCRFIKGETIAKEFDDDEVNQSKYQVFNCKQCRNVASFPVSVIDSDIANTFEIQNSIFPITNYVLFKTRILYLDFLLRNQAWNRLIEVMQENINAYTTLFGKTYPLISIGRFLIFKASLNVDPKIGDETILRYGDQCVRALFETHGSYHSMYKEARNMFDMFQFEIRGKES